MLFCAVCPHEVRQTVFLPYYPTGTMERVTKEGVVATARQEDSYSSPPPPSLYRALSHSFLFPLLSA